MRLSVKTTVVMAGLLLLTPALALAPLYIKGNRFIQPTEQGDFVFILKGMDYQPGGSSGFHPDAPIDVLSDPDVCYRDASVLQHLGVNIIRIYNLNVGVNHDACMSIFDAAGIYVLLDVNSPVQSINRYDPESSYNLAYLMRIFQFIEAFKLYPNVAGFFAGNEVINDPLSARLSPKYIRAVQRDMKEYLALHSDRQIPVGYSAVDDTTFRADSWDYFRCTMGPNDLSKSDFYGINTYSWCSANDDFTTSGYANLEALYSNTNVPFIFSEYGCNAFRPRVFNEVSRGLYGPLASFTLGGLIYEYTEEPNSYGVVQVNPDASVEFLEDFDHLRAQYQSVHLPVIPVAAVSNTVDPVCAAGSPGLIRGKAHRNAVSLLSLDYDLPLPPAGTHTLLSNGVSTTNIGQLVSVDFDSLAQRALGVFDSNGQPSPVRLRPYGGGNIRFDWSAYKPPVTVRGATPPPSRAG